MPKNVIITPASGLIDFKDDAGNIDAFIQLDGSGNLNISNTGGNLSLGNTATDVYIGDGVNSVDIIFEQNGDIRALAGKTLTLGQSDSNITVASPTTFNSTVTITGNLTVNGTTTTVNSTTLTVDDKNIELGSIASPTDVTADGGGITLKGTTDKTFNWVDATDAWTSSEDLNLLTGKVYEINGTVVLSSTTLGSGVTSSSLASVGTINTGVWNGTVITGQYGGTGVANTGKTITLGGNLTTSGAFTTTLTSTANTSVTLPTTGTLATLAGTETLTNKTISGANNTLSNIANASLSNSSITIGSTNVSLGATSTSLAGITSVTFAGSTSGTTQVVSGAIASTSVLTLPVATDTLVGKATTDTFTNKSISGSTNTLSNIANASLTNSSVTVNGTSISLGSSGTVTAAATTLTGTSLNATVVTSSLTSVGTIGTGVWQGTPVAVLYGGTGTSTGSITGTSALTFTAGGTNTNINLVPNGTGTVDVASKRITNLADPTGAQDAATKNYVDAFQQGLHVHASCAAATTNSLATLTGGSVTYNNGTAGVGATLTLGVALTTLDGYTLVNGDRILVKNEANTPNNGIYTRTSSTVLTRATDFDTGAEIAGGDFTFVTNGTLYNSTGWTQLDEVTTVGTDAIAFQQFSGAGTYVAGTGLTLTGSTFSVNSAQTQITSVGTINTGVWEGTIITGQYGGTGINNSGKSITLGGNLTTSGAFATTFTTTSTTNVTLPTTGTLATLAGSETFTNKTINLTSNTLVATSAQIASAVTDETGSGALVFATSPTLVTPILGTPTSGTLTNCTGLPVSGITASTSTALGVGSIELGHANDTTLSRSSAGVLAVEGVVVPTVSSTNTLTNKTLTSPIINSATINNGTLTGTLTAGGSVGTNGYYLQTTGSGVQWAEVDTSSVIGYNNSTVSAFPSGDYNGADAYVGHSGSGTDAFGVSIITIFTCMDPVGSTQTTDLGVLT